MEKFEVAEFWASEMQFGDTLPFDLLLQQFSIFSDVDEASFANLLRQLDYQTFLRTRYWYAIRLQIHATRKVCEACRQPDNTQVHHITYQNHGQEHRHLLNLRLLCSRCHMLVTIAVESMKGQQRG